MYLKNIEVQGFKSFANKTVFQFHNGITGIVGPNGSGKSNVADAVRWVLGEQRVKQLRGGSMQDVIFAGTQTRKPLGYASVSITLDNTDHALPISYDEVTVTRRLYRSGESEYLINGTGCRLKDINEMFYDTGIGKEGYSIIGQGQIDRILSGKPEERRELFDEAAGIVKFKRRKLEAARKLDSEQQNLLRVNDILAELTRQLGPLERQAEKARIYLNKRDELKAYDVNLFLTELVELKQRIEQAKENHAAAAREMEEVTQEAEKIRVLYDETTRELDQIDGDLAALQAQDTDQKLKKADLENQIRLIEEQLRSLEEAVERRRERAELRKQERSEKEQILSQTREGIAALHAHNEELSARSLAGKREQEALDQKIRLLNQDMEESTSAQMKLLSDRTAIRTKAQHFQTMLEQIGIRRAQLSSQILELKSEENSQEEKLKGLQLTAGEIARAIGELTAQSDAANSELQQVQERLNAANQEMEKRQMEYHRAASRLESLKNIAERYDGYGSSIRRVMELKGKERGLHGVVADLISTQKEYETAIETALGGSIQNIVTEEEETAKRMIAYLKENRFGRATFLPLTAMRRSEPFKQTSALNEKGVVGLASTLVRTEGKYAALASHLLGRTLVVDHIDHAVEIARKYKYSLRIVTLGGESLSPGGSMTGGAFKNGSNLLGRRREIEELQRAVLQERKALEQLKDTIDQTRIRRNELRDRIRELSAQLQERYLEKNTADLKASEMETLRSQTLESYQQIQEESREAAAQVDQIRKDQEDVASALSESEQRERQLKEDEEELREEALVLQQKEQEMAAALEALLVELTSGTQKEEYLQREIERITAEIESLDQEQVQLAKEEEQSAQDSVQKRGQIDQIREVILKMEAQSAALQEKAAALSDRKAQIGSSQKDFFDQREEISTRSTLLDREIYRLSSQIERMEETRENRISYMWEEYELTYSQAQGLRRDDLGSPSAWRKNMSALKKEIKELGSVNVNAIEEYKEVSERHAFLSAQQADLIKAEEALRKIIAQLDAGMRTQFKEQFARIQEEFDKSFKQLFGGGQGTLELVEEEDILEAGIRIIAQPPGKKLQNMMQLSGGEKALTAIALLFAIQNLKPSPFCLLDEIEAALDESNVDRYASYLHKLTKHTQFIIITHRRGTMTAADRLYGVTMQEKGVSALVSVDLIEGQLDQ